MDGIRTLGDCWLCPISDLSILYHKYNIEKLKYPFRNVMKKETYEIVGRWIIKVK